MTPDIVCPSDAKVWLDGIKEILGGVGFFIFMFALFIGVPWGHD